MTQGRRDRNTTDSACLDQDLRPDRSTSTEKIAPGHIEKGWELDAEADLAHNRKHFELFAESFTHAKKKPQVEELYRTFKDAFPQVQRFDV